MNDESVERRLTTILAADVVGYSRLMGHDEAGTLAELKAQRKELIDPKAAQYHGRTIKLMGDGVLMEFGSVVDAVTFAVEAQCAMRARNAEVPEDRRIGYRIGINIGDIIVEGDDIYGDGVNIAARLEGSADPGGICLSRNVYDQVKDKLDLTFEHLGEREMKNIAEPVSVYGVVLNDRAAALTTPVILQTAKSERWRRPAAAAVVALVIVAGGLVWWQPWVQRVEPAVLAKMALPLPENPSIAVLPFDNLSEEPEQAYFADGMTEDLITDLSKLSGLFVISRNSTFTYKGKPVKVRQVAEDLGVRYVLEGSVRRAGDQVRINAQLIDAVSGYHLWAERYDGSLVDVFKLQDNVVGKIVAALAVNLTTSESAQAGKMQTEVPAAYDAFLQGRDHYRRHTPQDYAKAIRFFEKAIELDPDYSRAYANLAGIYWFAHDLKWDVHLGIEYQAIDRAKHYLAKALERPTSDAYQVSAEMLLAQGRNNGALAEIDRAISLEPNNPDGYVTKAWALTLSGRAKEAEQNARLAMRLNPNYGANYLRQLGRALFYQRRHAEAAEVLARAVNRQPHYEFAYRRLAAIYGHLGRIDDAKVAVKKYNELTAKTIGGQLTVKRVENVFGGGWYELDKAYLAHLLEGLRKAGVPEGAVAETTVVNFNDLVTRSAGRFDVKGAAKIDAAGAKILFDRGVVFVDSRSAGPYRRGHIPGAVNLFFATSFTKESLSKVVKPDEEVVFYCGGEDCNLSPKSCAKALVWGYSKVYYFAAGFPAWKAAGYQVETQ